MKMYDSILKRVRQIEHKNGITYAKPDGVCYKTASVIYIISGIWNVLLGLIYCSGLVMIHSGKETFDEALRYIIFGITCSVLVVGGFIFNRFKFYTVGGILSIPSIIGFICMFGSVSVDDFGFLGFTTRFYLLNLIPLLIMLICGLIITVLPIRAKLKTQKLYKKVVEELFARFGENYQLSDVEWEEFLKNYDHIAYKNIFKEKEKAEQDE